MLMPETSETSLQVLLAVHGPPVSTNLSTSNSNLRQLSVGSRFQNELSQDQEKSSQQ